MDYELLLERTLFKNIIDRIIFFFHPTTYQVISQLLIVTRETQVQATLNANEYNIVKFYYSDFCS